MSTGTYCTKCNRYIDLPDQPVAEESRCKCARPVRSDGRDMPAKRSNKFVTLTDDGQRIFHACPDCSSSDWKTFHPSGKCSAKGAVPLPSQVRT